MKTKRKRWHLQIDAFLRIDKLLRCLLDSFFVTYIYISPFLYPRLILVSTSIYIYLFSSCRAVHSYTPVPRKRNKSWQRLISLSFTISCLSFFFFWIVSLYSCAYVELYPLAFPWIGWVYHMIDFFSSSAFSYLPSFFSKVPSFFFFWGQMRMYSFFFFKVSLAAFPPSAVRPLGLFFFGFRSTTMGVMWRQ